MRAQQDDAPVGPPVTRTRVEARDLLEATAPYDPPPSSEPPEAGTVLRGGLHYLNRLHDQVPDLARTIATALRTDESQQAELYAVHPLHVLELAHPPAYQQLLSACQRDPAKDPEEVVQHASGALARAWEQTLLVVSHRKRSSGVEAHLADMNRELEQQAQEAEELLRHSRGLRYLSAGGAARFSDCYVDISRELVAEALTEGNEVHGRVVVGLPEGSELMGAGWVPENTGTLRLWFNRPGHTTRVGDVQEAILVTTEQTHRPTFGLARGSGPNIHRLVAEWLRRTREELEKDQATVAPDEDQQASEALGVYHKAHAVLDDLEGTLRGWPRG